mmetsp:Transcript_31393/g.50863  ORF Transcript_31393/g.50863 Transcript_31393/m.50863 type:complete len:159 (-) Transcript_31393:98-574(-)|eukprot:CAMPEP_0202713330 /NCGR_PEP_ID=MMETSP1385-20130828/52674_1 /ASSEMBLY_ACC=CAM_ASM_000861 /TAXON_ID=933848 /ORGANISM="Elphidium margaritaceum" /LENGTH=158 /DNA_ID=CAMNT_0049373651 /DNA_START=102 /DNA_END=578 /DNA_ORIENTATION=-
MTTNPEWQRMNEIQRGALLFHIKCQRCHANTKGDDYRRGPNLWGVVGRKAGGQGYTSYSEALKKSGLFWTRQTIKRYMHDPTSFVPGTKMFYGAALPADNQTECIVSYLESISPGFEERINEHKEASRAKIDEEAVFQSLSGHPDVPLFGAPASDEKK